MAISHLANPCQLFFVEPLSATPDQTGDQGDDKQYDCDPEKQGCSGRRRPGNASEPKQSRNDSYNQKYDGPVE
jgi:hypothetical protein